MCFFCNKKGHYKSDCPDRLAWEKMKKNGLKNDIVAVLEKDNDDSDGVGFF